MMCKSLVVIAAMIATACGGAAQKGDAAGEPAAQTSAVPPLARGPQIDVADLFHLQSVTDVQLSPDGSHATFTVVSNDRIGAPWSQIWMADLAGGRAARWPG